ncbi:CDP-alcohol phosphatidyltransferase family protein [uncultured Cocleimonas sp.]|uniref:CDP-alcohol phosphatidyltransferase family protein n=1 Tax=uncultured Cocleimonas sp. TaxID=1051587 RepID=UPI002613701E|nr:CDP-alcohol phosphatidyltransferase family protein [uncultured Cocleimonas sp.]
MHHIPNIISALRILLVLPIAHQLLHAEWKNALILIFVAGISDAIDGFLARNYKWQSKLGGFLDPLADKLLLTVVFVTLAYKDIIPNWLAILVISRDLIILLGAIVYHWVTRELRMTPILISKINTTMQITFVLALMYHLAINPMTEPVLNILKYGVAITTLLSGIMYVIHWSRYTIKYLSKKQHNKNGAI